MATKAKFQAIRGTRDLLPPETALWNRVEQTAHEVFAKFGFGEIRTPIFETTELFARSIGADTEVVGKEMYPVSSPAYENLRHEFNTLFIDLATLPASGSLKASVFSLIEFVERVRDAIDSGDIPRTDANLAAFEKLKEVRKRSQDLAKFDQLIAPASPGQLNQLGKELDSAFSHLNPKAAKELDQVRNASYSAFSDLSANISLRPEATASVCRAYIEHGMQQLPQPVKLYYM